MSEVGPHSSNPKSPEVVTTNQPMQYGPPGYYPNVQYVQKPGYQQMPMAQPVCID
ncbi:hypothetical protein CHS0354_008161 [Potamilus streckersoni]|uniref:Uncharacterized protein n=1 Tax=Potamilus streckersoni TaxID=2493646 RepID=A0AAE0VXE3_9BIVA|nr:hypothetical protein CHS0354_008161 [Potamilus streckersoni]